MAWIARFQFLAVKVFLFSLRSIQTNFVAHKADHSPSVSTKVKIGEVISPLLPPFALMALSTGTNLKYMGRSHSSKMSVTIFYSKAC
jgi:hypothetical protein